MSPRITISLIIARFGWISVGAALACDPCGNTVVSKVPSPDSARHAVIFERSCGATTGFSTQVSVLPSNELPRATGNVFVADTDHGHAPPAAWGGPDVSVRWISPSVLELTYDLRARVFAHVATIDGTTLVYVQRPSASRP